MHPVSLAPLRPCGDIACAWRFMRILAAALSDCNAPPSAAPPAIAAAISAAAAPTQHLAATRALALLALRLLAATDLAALPVAVAPASHAEHAGRRRPVPGEVVARTLSALISAARTGPEAVALLAALGPAIGRLAHRHALPVQLAYLWVNPCCRLFVQNHMWEEKVVFLCTLPYHTHARSPSPPASLCRARAWRQAGHSRPAVGQHLPGQTSDPSIPHSLLTLSILLSPRRAGGEPTVGGAAGHGPSSPPRSLRQHPPSRMRGRTPGRHRLSQGPPSPSPRPHGSSCQCYAAVCVGRLSS